jgi:hypothetical protein
VQLKVEFQEQEEDMTKAFPRYNQVMPISYLLELEGDGMMFYSKRKEFREKKNMRHLTRLAELKPFDPLDGSLSVVSE